MSLNLDVQQKAQAELDLVVGSDRLPYFDDRDKLVYIQAAMLESVRWLPVGPLALPHRVMSDDSYAGFRIPRGATILVVSSFVIHLGVATQRANIRTYG